ncbi:CRISPR-associated helicase Cas3' [Treponema primitia]|uniref:CRISPR-associated helicase Cas3' n=1 Tax=Treponema primitia TaxID=88058 RepID=UPI00397E9FB2
MKNGLFDILNNIPSLLDCLAKTIASENGQIKPGIDVLGHCIIVGEISKALIQRFIPEIREQFFPSGSELIAASHDIGKVYPLFQTRLQDAISGHPSNPERDKPWKGHAGVSLAALDGSPKFIPQIAGRHHGYLSPEYFKSNYEHFGGPEWQKQREKLLQKLMEHFGVGWPTVKDKVHAALLSGLTSVSDWIGSGSNFDTITDVRQISGLPARVQEALDQAGFVLPRMKKDLSFEYIFNNKSPRPAQSAFIDTVSTPGVYVLEAPMGMGKTEAALYAAYRLYASGKASGIYFALPTQLTSDKIYTRFEEFLDKVLEENSSLPKSVLVHSSAWITETEMGKAGAPGKDWFHSGKRRILAPFGVGTIDQALMAVMNVKYGFIRTFGLMGKVVILDEVHSYDSYTGTLLDTLVKWLEKMGCTVIILSATLTGERKNKILNLDEQNFGASSPYPLISVLTDREKGMQEIPAKSTVESTGSPHVSIKNVSDDAAFEEALKRAEQGQQILWIENTVDEAQKRYSDFTGRIGNLTITVEFGLLHSRFTKHDRKENEDKWVDLFGEKGKERRQECGRILVGTQVLEQSLDIDADFLVTRICPTDMLLQRIGRLWRHNDTVRPAEAHCEAWILMPEYEKVLAGYNKKTENVFNQELGKTSYVYDPYVLLRTIEIWRDLTSLTLPEDIRPLVEATYAERNEKAPLDWLKGNLQKKRSILEIFALRTTDLHIKTLPDTGMEVRNGHSYSFFDTSNENHKTRYSEIETIEVLLFYSEPYYHDNGDISLVLSPDDPNDSKIIKLNLKRGLKQGTKEEQKEWRRQSAKLHKHIVTVPVYKAPLPANQKTLDRFREYIYTGSPDHGEETLRIAIVKKTGELTGINGTKISDSALSYTNEIGYLVK